MGRYSRIARVKAKSARARMEDVRTSYKNTFEVAAAIRGKGLLTANRYLKACLQHKNIIPFRRHCIGVGRKAQANHLGANQGRWPEKSIRFVKRLLKNVKINAISKSLQVDKLVISHIQVNRATCGRRRTYRAHGRITPYLSHHCHIE